jgi:hypothetical protein
MDAWVAEKVMEWKKKKAGEIVFWGWGKQVRNMVQLVKDTLYDAVGYPQENPRPYSTDIAAAWEAVEKIHELGFRTDLESGWENLNEYFAWRCKFYKPHYLETAHHETASLAICRAALKAVLGE